MQRAGAGSIRCSAPSAESLRLKTLNTLQPCCLLNVLGEGARCCYRRRRRWWRRQRRRRPLEVTVAQHCCLVDGVVLCVNAEVTLLTCRCAQYRVAVRNGQVLAVSRRCGEWRCGDRVSSTTRAWRLSVLQLLAHEGQPIVRDGASSDTRAAYVPCDGGKVNCADHGRQRLRRQAGHALEM